MVIRFEDLFSLPSKLDGKDEKVGRGYHTQDEWRTIESRKNSEKRMERFNRFKDTALGNFRQYSIKNLEEMAQLLYQVGFSFSLEEGKKLTLSLIDGKVFYTEAGFFKSKTKYLAFNKVNNETGETSYRIELHTVLPLNYDML